MLITQGAGEQDRPRPLIDIGGLAWLLGRSILECAVHEGLRTNSALPMLLLQGQNPMVISP